MKSNFKKFSFIVFTYLLLSVNSLNAGIPVVDIAGNTQTIIQNIKQVAEWIKEAERWIDTSKHYSSQLDAYARQLATQSGIRDVTSFLKKAEDIYAKAQRAGTTLGQIRNLKNKKGKLASEVKKLMDEFFEYDYCQDIIDFNENIKNICYQKRSQAIEDILFFKGRSNAISDISKNISILGKKMAKSKDIKESSDLNNAIQSQIALMQAEKIQIDLYIKQREYAKIVMADMELENRMKKLNNYIDWSSK